MMSTLLHCIMEISLKIYIIHFFRSQVYVFVYVFMCFPLIVCWGAGNNVKSAKTEPLEAQLLLG